MSVVCCQVKESCIEVASDNQLTWGDVKLADHNTSFCKLDEINGMIIGAIGLAHEGSLFQLFCATRKPGGHDCMDILSFMAEFAEWKNGKTKKYEVENTYILVFEKHAFEIDGFEVAEIVSYSAIGSGRAYALAAMFLECSVEKAVEVASKFNLYCSGQNKYFKVDK